MEDAFRRVVVQIFNNWTALQLAVEHSMAGPNSKSTALEFLDYMTKFCLYDSGINEESIQDALEDILDQEFETICEDGSTKEIAVLFNKFLELLKAENTAQFELEFNGLPANNEWLVQSPKVEAPQPVAVAETIVDKRIPEGTHQTAEVVPMEEEEDSEWMEVKPRRRR